MSELSPEQKEQAAKALENVFEELEAGINWTYRLNLLRENLAKVGLQIVSHPFKTKGAYEDDSEMAWDDDLGWMHKDSLSEVNKLRQQITAKLPGDPYPNKDAREGGKVTFETAKKLDDLCAALEDFAIATSSFAGFCAGRLIGCAAELRKQLRVEVPSTRWFEVEEK